MKPNLGSAFIRAVCVLALGVSFTAPAQWLTQPVTLKPGWNGVYLHVDASHATLADLVGADVDNPILEVWLWRPAPSTMQFVQNPQTPAGESSQWSSWSRASSGSSQLQRLVPNAAYLVRVATNVPTYVWQVKGKPAAPNYQWTTTGLNFLGFPSSPGAPPTFESFLAQVPELKQSIEVYHYTGGDLEAGNPARLFTFRTTPVERGKTFWIRSGDLFNRYYGPFEVSLSGGSGIDFHDSLSTASFRLRNLSSGSLTVTLNLRLSEAPPAGQSSIAGVPPLLVRGSLNPTNLTYDYTNLVTGVPQSWTLAAKGQPGSDKEIVLGLNRSAMAFAPGSLAAATLRLTDSLGHSEVDIPVTATAASAAGLWVGGVQLTQVGQYLKSYQLDGDRKPILDSQGKYVVSGLNTNLASVPRPFPLRLILHNPDSGNAVLLQRVYCGLDANTNYIIATAESPLNRQFLTQARRITSVHLPWSAENTGWTFDGKLGDASELTAQVSLDYKDHASNPFLHTYHPDHDNLNSTFQAALSQGSESYSVNRDIALRIAAPASDFASLTSSGRTIMGEYVETVTLQGLARAGGTQDTRQFQVRGTFSLNHLSAVPTLTRVP
jgi:hypothetical protein